MAFTPLSLRAVTLFDPEPRCRRRDPECAPAQRVQAVADVSSDDTPTDVLPSSTATSSVSSTTSAAYCSPTPTFHPERCFVSLPTACIDLRLGLEPPYGAQDASYCQDGLMEISTVMPEATPCFSDQYAATFNPATAYA